MLLNRLPQNRLVRQKYCAFTRQLNFLPYGSSGCHASATSQRSSRFSTANLSPSPTPREIPKKPLPNARPTTSSDLIEQWTPAVFKKVGVAAFVGSVATCFAVGPVAGSVAMIMTVAYWKIGLADMKQTKHSILRNFPLLGHVRYALESIRPGEISRHAGTVN